MKFLIFVSIVFIFASCNGSKNKINRENITFDSIAHNYYCSVDINKQVVLNSDKEYQQIWMEIYANLDQMPRMPEVDLSKYTVIAVFMGVKNTGGFDVKIDKISDFGEKIIVNFTELSPGINCMVTDAITKPYEFVKTKKTGKDIEFVKNNITKDCP